MKKILLTAVNAKYIHSNLAVYSLRAYARELKENIVLAEYTIKGDLSEKAGCNLLFLLYLEHFHYFRSGRGIS